MFRVRVRASAEKFQNYFEAKEHCDGSDADVIADEKCTIPIKALLEEPFLLQPGARIHVQVTATTSDG